MTYCLGIKTHEGLVMASDSRANAGYDQVNICRKMHTFAKQGERVFVILTSGSLSITQSVITLLRNDFQQGAGLATASGMYEAARVVGACVRAVSDIDRDELAKDDYAFNIHLLLGGQVKGKPSDLYLIYPHLSAGQSDLRDRRVALSAARRSEIWPADPGPGDRCTEDDARIGVEIRDAFLRCHHALECDGRSAYRVIAIPQR